MNKKIRIGTVTFLCLSCIIVTFLLTYTYLGNKMESSGRDQKGHEKLLAKIINVENAVNKKFLGTINEDDVIDGVVGGYINSLNDNYSTYLNKVNFRAYNNNLDGVNEGIGVNVAFDKATGGILVDNVLKNSPAQQAGIMMGDIITYVDGSQVSNIGYFSALAKMSGKDGTTVALSILREDEKLDITVTRRKIKIVTVENYVMLEGNVAFIKINEFERQTIIDFTEQVRLAMEAGATGIVFDVRDNRGGSITAITEILDILVPEGVIVTVEYKTDVLNPENSQPKVYNSDENEIDLPMVVLINENTASAAELFAACLHDYGKAKLVGETTYGKGVGQEIISLGDETAILITTLTYKTPNGVNYDGVGVSPDQVVALTDEEKAQDIPPGQDRQVIAALNYFTAAS